MDGIYQTVKRVYKSDQYVHSSEEAVWELKTNYIKRLLRSLSVTNYYKPYKSF